MYSKNLQIGENINLCFERDLTSLDDIIINVASIDTICNNINHIGTYNNGIWEFSSPRSSIMFWSDFYKSKIDIIDTLKELSNPPKNLKSLLKDYSDKKQVGLLTKFCNLITKKIY